MFSENYYKHKKYEMLYYCWRVIRKYSCSAVSILGYHSKSSGNTPYNWWIIVSIVFDNIYAVQTNYFNDKPYLTEQV